MDFNCSWFLCKLPPDGSQKNQAAAPGSIRGTWKNQR